MEPKKLHVTKRLKGEYSTVVLPNGVIETLWYAKGDNDGVLVGVTYPPNLKTTALKHIQAYEAR